ncbi:hypothetical protein, partial [Klebsiella pneumoniae]|uniref:hypothetical protein n=1 Tax=Klebsiella pneumoniae TaxID=573 RepID=UPI003B5BCEDA
FLQLCKSSLSPRSLPKSSDCDSFNSEIFSATGSNSSLLAGDGEFSPAAASTAATTSAGGEDASESDMRIEGGSALVVA